MSQRFVFAFALLTLAAATTGLAGAATVTIDGAPVTGVVAKDGHLMVPFRAPLESIGAKVNWDPASSVASATYGGGDLVTVTVGSTDALVTDTPKTLTVAPVLENGYAYIPVETLADISHATVNYSADHQSATVTGWDLAGVDDVGGGGNKGVLGIWVWILAIGGIIGIIAAIATGRQVAAAT